MAEIESYVSELSNAIGSDHRGPAGRLSEILSDAIQALIEVELIPIPNLSITNSSQRLETRNTQHTPGPWCISMAVDDTSLLGRFLIRVGLGHLTEPWTPTRFRLHSESGTLHALDCRKFGDAGLTVATSTPWATLDACPCYSGDPEGHVAAERSHLRLLSSWWTEELSVAGDTVADRSAEPDDWLEAAVDVEGVFRRVVRLGRPWNVNSFLVFAWFEDALDTHLGPVDETPGGLRMIDTASSPGGSLLARRRIEHLFQESPDRFLTISTVDEDRFKVACSGLEVTDRIVDHLTPHFPLPEQAGEWVAAAVDAEREEEQTDRERFAARTHNRERLLLDEALDRYGYRGFADTYRLFSNEFLDQVCKSPASTRGLFLWALQTVQMFEKMTSLDFLAQLNDELLDEIAAKQRLLLSIELRGRFGVDESWIVQLPKGHSNVHRLANLAEAVPRDEPRQVYVTSSVLTECLEWVGSASEEALVVDKAPAHRDPAVTALAVELAGHGHRLADAVAAAVTTA